MYWRVGSLGKLGPSEMRGLLCREEWEVSWQICLRIKRYKRGGHISRSGTEGRQPHMLKTLIGYRCLQRWRLQQRANEFGGTIIHSAAFCLEGGNPLSPIFQCPNDFVFFCDTVRNNSQKQMFWIHQGCHPYLPPSLTRRRLGRVQNIVFLFLLGQYHRKLPKQWFLCDGTTKFICGASRVSLMDPKQWFV